MPEAVIVSVARSPIGRAMKGSLVEFRPDDLAALMVREALAKVPALDPATLDDLMLGCGQPAGEGGFNMARVVAVLAGLDGVPGVTVNRYCSSSLQTTRMAFHAIKAGEGHAFVSAGVETVSRFAGGFADGGAQNPRFAAASARSAQRATGVAHAWTDPRDAGDLPDVYIAMGQTAENVAQVIGMSRQEQDAFGVRSQNLAEGRHRQRLLGHRHRAGHHPERHGRQHGRRARRGARRLEKAAGSQARLPPRRHHHRRQRLPAQRRRRRRDRHERPRRPRPWASSPLARIVSSGVSGLSTPRSWASARSRRPARPWRWPV
jgi:hypothetical protein